MKTSLFNYQLPDQAIARTPIEPRDRARLLVSRSEGELIDSSVRDLSTFLESGDLLVVNNTKVLPARIEINRASGGKGEIFLLSRIDEGIWKALVKPSFKIKTDELVYSKGISNCVYKFEIGEDLGEGHRIVKFIDSNETQVIGDVGRTPLPPYLGEVDIPLERYQTVFAEEEKSVAAPTAGLHFTNDLIKDLKLNNIAIAEVTLHVGVGTFRPIMTEDIEDHKMHFEQYHVRNAVYEKIQSTKLAGKKVVAVGTTSLRTLESVAHTNKLYGSTNLYCHGDFDFKIIDLLFTNFHQPQSSLLVLLDSFVGERWRTMYEHALKANYRFLSFGDAMLVGPKMRSKV